MALFKINKGLNANLPVPRHDGYAYFTTDDGKFWIDFEDNTDGVLQDDGTKVSRKALNAERADYVGYALTLQFDGDNQPTYNGLIARTYNISPENIHALSTINGGTVAGPVTLNNVLTVNNDAYIDSATIGDLLVNGGTRFVGDVNAGKITSSQFIGPLQGNATSADKVNYWLKIQVNGTDKVQYDGSGSNKTINLTADMLGLLGNTTPYALGDAVGGNAVAANKLNTNAGSTTRPVYFDAGIPKVISNTDEVDLIAKSANAVKENFIFQVKGTEQWRYNGSTSRTMNLTPSLIDAFDIVEGSTVSGEAIFNNVVYLNDETYADSLTAENEIITGTLRVVGDLNGSVINATTFNGALNGNATSADKVNHWLKIQLNGTDAAQYDGSGSNKTVNITASGVGALDSGTLYAGSTTQGGSASSAVKLDNDKDAGSNILPVYFSSGVPVAVSTSDEINILARQANKTTYWLKIQTDSTDQVTFDGSTSNKTINITPELINAVRRNGDTIPGPLTINGVFTVNNDVYMDSATVGDLLVNGGTRFVGDVNAGKIIASQFIGPLQGNATSADKVNNWLKIQVNGTDKVQYDGSGGNKTINLTAEMLGLLGNTTLYALGDAVGGNAVKANALNVSAAIGSTTRPVYIQASGVPAAISNTDEIDLVAKSANAIKENFIFQVKGTEQWRYNGSTARTMNLSPALIDAFDIVEGSTVSGEAIFNNVVYLNDETYADSLTAENEIVTGTLRVVGDLNGSVINATTFNGNLNGNATSADKVNHWLKIQFNGTDQAQFDGSGENKTVNITPSAIGALSTSTNYAGSTSVGGAANSANKLNTDAGDATHPVYFDNGVPVQVSGTQNINVDSADKVNHWLKIQTDSTDAVTYDGSTSNKTVNITPEVINAVRRNGDTIPGPLTINGVFTVNNDAYIDSATVGDLLVNGGTRFVGDVNAGKITSSQFVGPLQGNATSADKVNHWLKIQFNGTDKVQYDGSTENKTLNITPSGIGALASTTNYAGSSSVGGAATSANKLNTNAGSSTLPVYFTGGVPSAVSTSDEINIVAKQANKTTYWLKIQTDSTDQVTFDGSTSNKTLNITPELINAVRRNGDTIPGPLTLNGVFTVNNDAYIDSATIGDLLVNGGTRFVGDVNAGKITASSFVGPLTGNASTADKVNHWLKIQVNGTDKVQYDGSSENKTLNLTPSMLGVLGNSTQYALGDAVGGNAVKANALNLNMDVGSSVLPVYFKADGTPEAVSSSDEVGITVRKANSVDKDYIYQLRGSEQWRYNGSANRTLNIVPNDMGIFDTIEGSTVSGEAIFNNVVYLNDETYADSLTAENEIVTGTLRVVGDLNGSVVNATTFNGNATSADKVNHWLKIQVNGTDKVQFDGSSENKTLNLTPSLLGLLGGDTTYALGDAVAGNAVAANKLTVNAGSSTLPVYFTGGVPSAVSTTDTIDIVAKQANKTTYWLKIQADSSDQVTFDGSTQNKTLNITPELINAVRRNGDTIPGPLTLNGVFTVNNDAYIDSATIGDLLVNGGTRFVGDVNAGKITASSFVGPLTGNADTATKVNNWLKIQFNGTDQCTYYGNSNTTVNITPAAILAIPLGGTASGSSITGSLEFNNADIGIHRVGRSVSYRKGRDSALVKTTSVNGYGALASIKTTNGSWEIGAYDSSGTADDLLFNYVPDTTYNSDSNSGYQQIKFLENGHIVAALDGNASSASKVSKTLKYQLRGSDQWTYNGSTARVLNIAPNDMGIFDTIEGSTVQGEAVFNNVVYLNDETYADSLTAENEIVTGTLRVVGDLNASVINATTLNGNATTADQLNHWLKIQFNGTDKVQYDGSTENKTLNITPVDINAVNLSGDTMTGDLQVPHLKITGTDQISHIVFSRQTDNYIKLPLSTTKLYIGTGAAIGNAWYGFASDGIHPARAVSDSNIKTLGTESLPWTAVYANTLYGNATSADKVNYWLKIQADGTDQVTFDGSIENKTLDITPELINAVRRNGDTIPGPLTLNGVMTINNDAYIDSATIGDLLVNGGTRFVGDVNAGNITASQFTGPLAGNATSADKVNHWLKIQFNGTDQAQYDGSGDNKTVNVTPNAIAAAPQVNGVYYGTCATAKATKAKEVILVNGTGFQLVAGAMLVVKFTYASAAATMTLKVGTDAASAAAATGHTLYQYGSEKMSSTASTNGWPAGAVVLFIYDGTSWFRQFWYNNQYTLPTVTNIDCGTADSDSAKVITNGAWYNGTAGNLFEVTMRYANTYAGPLTFNDKPLYINGTASSANNYTLPAGKYIVFYDGTNYYFRTDGLIPHVNGIYKQRYGNSNIKGVANSRLYFLLSDYTAPTTAYPSDMYNKTIYYKAFYKIRGVSSNPSYNQNHMSGEFSTVVSVKINGSGESNLQHTAGYWSQVPTSFGGTSTIYISSDTNVVASKKHSQFYVTSYGVNDFEYEVELMSVEKIIVDDTNSTVGTPEELHTTSYTNDTYESCVFMNMTNTRTNCALLDTNYSGTISNYVYASQAFDASRLINYFTADNGTTDYYLTGRGSTTSGAYSYLYSNTKTYIKGSGLYSDGSLHMNDIYGTSGHTYGSTLPSSPTTGQLFFHVDGAAGDGGSLSLAQKTSGTMYVLGYDGSDNTKAYYNTNVYVNCSTGVLRGAAWNDYAEYRRDNHAEKRWQKPGNCVKENGDGTLSLTTKRLERGCEIISDTFGVSIGQDARNGYDTPIAVSGRVLAYPYESIEEFKKHIGYPVCSGPNGTVSIMTDEEEEKYSSRIIGIISEIPTYDKWGQGQVDVDGRVWIRIK